MRSQREKMHVRYHDEGEGKMLCGLRTKKYIWDTVESLKSGFTTFGLYFNYPYELFRPPKIGNRIKVKLDEVISYIQDERIEGSDEA